eukprot:2802295-Amphidinium_carterae.1
MDRHAIIEPTTLSIWGRRLDHSDRPAHASKRIPKTNSKANSATVLTPKHFKTWQELAVRDLLLSNGI